MMERQILESGSELSPGREWTLIHKTQEIEQPIHVSYVNIKG